MKSIFLISGGVCLFCIILILIITNKWDKEVDKSKEKVNGNKFSSTLFGMLFIIGSISFLIFSASQCGQIKTNPNWMIEDPRRE